MKQFSGQPQDKAQSVNPIENLVIQITGRFGVRQLTMVDEITKVIVGVNSLRSRLSLRELDKEENSFIELQRRALELQQCFYEPAKLLTEDEKKQIDKDEKIKTEVLGRFAMMDKRNYEEWNRRIFALLDHLERRISDKRSVINFNRTVEISAVAICISGLSIMVVVILHFI